MPDIKRPKQSNGGLINRCANAIMQAHLVNTQKVCKANAQKIHPGTNNAGRTSVLLDTEVHIDSQVNKLGCNILHEKTSTVCQNDNKPQLGVEMESKKHNQMLLASALHTKTRNSH